MEFLNLLKIGEFKGFHQNNEPINTKQNGFFFYLPKFNIFFFVLYHLFAILHITYNFVKLPLWPWNELKEGSNFAKKKMNNKSYNGCWVHEVRDHFLVLFRDVLFLFLYKPLNWTL
jgi:hypothetical protein